ncbi:ABC transporter permease [Clostridiaceae bacterium M8S5]|nr:ABC transporter permease [Clostridiaceae bacterium M8S5]
MARYLFGKVASLIIVLLGVTMLSFALANISEVDPAQAQARRNTANPTTEQIEEIREEMGLNLPIYKQYLKWVKDFIKGDLGTSLISKNPVVVDILKKIPATLSIVGMGVLWIIVITLPVGVILAIKKDSFFDHVMRMITIFGISIPNFWLGFMLLVLFAIIIPVFDVVDYGSFKSLILPSLTLAIPIISSSIRLFRSTLISNMNSDYITYAKARGLSNFTILKHLLKNSLSPMITLLFQNLGYMISGSAIVESVFSWPGLGRHLVGAIIGRDLPTINGCVLLMGVVFVVCNLIADILNGMINPRLLSEMEEC